MLEVSEMCVGSVGRIVITYSQGGNRFGGDLKLVEVVGMPTDCNTKTGLSSPIARGEIASVVT